MSDKLRDQINELIRDESQEVINDYVDAQEESQKAVLGVVGKEDEKELKVNVRKSEVDKLIYEYKKIKKKERSNLNKIKSLGLVDKNGNPL